MLDNTDGFTITELLVAITSGALVAVTVLSISLFFFADLMRGDAETQMTLESQNILRGVVEDLRVGTQVNETNVLADANEPGGGWNTSSDEHILIVSVPALDDDNDVIFDESTGEPYQNEIVYFEEETVLYKRTLADTAAAGNTSLTTCPLDLSSVSCPADARLTENFDDMLFIFYDQNGSVTTVVAEARSIDITVLMNQTIFGKPVNAINNIRMTMRNPV